MKSRSLAIIMLVALIMVSTGLLWNCGCAFAEQVVEETSSCHEQPGPEANTECCTGCQAEHNALAPSTPYLTGLTNVGARFPHPGGETLPLHPHHSNGAFVGAGPISNVGVRDAVRLQPPLYLTHQSLLI